MGSIRSVLIFWVSQSWFFQCDGFLAADYASPLVFDAAFYVNTWPDLHIFHTVEAAKSHWLTNGIKEGRQACGSFHTAQYLHRYGDLAKAYGSNYLGAIQHYLSFGIKEHRLGYVEGGFDGRWTISNSKDIFVSASSRMAGAVDSLVWNNKEFINAWDHGRNLQTAINADSYGQCFNPTEAGSSVDASGSATSSALKGISAKGRVLKATKEPAYWLPKGTHQSVLDESETCHIGSPSVAPEKVYHHPFSTQVDIGCFGMENCIVYHSSFTIAGPWPQHSFINLEAPSASLTNDFQVEENYDPATNRVKPFTSNSKPVILRTFDSKYAIGVYAPPGQDTDYPMYYSIWNSHGEFASGTNKWSVVFRKKFPQISTHVLKYVTYMCVGNPIMVTQCLQKLTHGH